MELEKKLLLSLVAKSEFKIENLITALEELSASELPRFIAVMLDMKKTDIHIGQNIFSPKKNKHIFIISNNFVKDSIAYEYEVTRYAKEPEGDFNRSNTMVAETDTHKHPVNVVITGCASYEELF